MGSAAATSTATARSTSSRRTGGGAAGEGSDETPWTFHQGAFGRNGNAGGNIEAYDVNGDKLPDIVTASPHMASGWRHEQKRDAGGKISFVEHLIMNDFGSQNAGGVTFSSCTR